MTQDRNYTFMKTLRGVLVATMMVLASGNAMAQTTGVKVNGNVYGGGNAADVGVDATVNITHGTVSGSVYGGGFGEATVVTGNVLVNIGAKDPSSQALSGDATITGDVYGGSAKGKVNYNKTNAAATENATTQVNIYGTSTGDDNGVHDVYGGGHGLEDNSADVYGVVKVTVEGGKARNVYGCNNLKGSPQQSVEVNIKGGTITEDVFGGGHEADALQEITVNISGGTVRDVYGGGALASTNTANWDATGNEYILATGLTDNQSIVTGLYTKSGTTYTLIETANAKAEANTDYYIKGAWSDATNKSAKYKTSVKLTGGTVGNAYGGGLGDAATPAYVWGDVLVDLNGTTTYDTNGNVLTTPITAKGCIVNSIFGCNNVNGTPKGEVLVHVHATQSGVSGKETVSAKSDKNSNTYDVEAVYGGGNQAEYYPVRADATDASETNHVHTNVIIDGCTQTSIKSVYGGGNAASTPATSVTVNGAYEIGEVFGGGNGAGDDNPGANVGFHAYDAKSEAFDTPEERLTKKYGFGKSQVTINGGLIHAVYGGSNEKGNIREVAIAMLDKKDDSCDFEIGKAYGGGKAAPMDGRAILDLGCIEKIDEVYGGAESADVHNDVVLNITNGTYKKVYGGNNTRGHIYGTITVNIEETGCKPIIIDEVYGGGNLAPYYVTDIPNDANHTALSFDDADVLADNYYKNYPKVNVISATRIGKVFGGGDNAAVTGNPHVKVDMVQGQLSTKTEAEPLGVIGQVFGGGNNAGVTGSTYVDIVKGQITYQVTVPAVGETPAHTLSPGVYGGCNTSGTISGDTHLTLTGATIGTSTATGNVFGGGKGANTVVSGSSLVNFGTKSNDATPVYAGSTDLYGDIYGGSEEGSVNTVALNLYSGTIHGDAYGGGYKTASGKTAATDVIVTLEGTKFEITTENDDNGKAVPMTGRVFGCNNLEGSPQGSVTVNVNKTSDLDEAHKKTALDDRVKENATHRYNVQAVYGGGNLAAYDPDKGTTESPKTPKVEVNINGCDDTSIEYVYGGGNAAPMQTATNVKVEGAYEIGYTFGGGNGSDRIKSSTSNTGWIENPGANVNGTVTSSLIGGFIHNVFGGSNTKGTTGEAKIEISETGNGCDLTTENVHGAGMNADVEGDVNLRIGCLSDNIKNVYGGAKAAKINGNVTLTVTSGILDNVYGGNNESGSISGKITVNIEEVDACKPIVIGNLYGGGNLAPYPGPGFTENNPGIEVNVKSFTSIGNIYGGGRGADAIVSGNTVVNINEVKGKHAATARAAAASTINDVEVNIPEHKANEIGAIGNVYGGGDLAAVQGNVTVNIGTETAVDFVYEPKHLKESETDTEKYTYDSTAKLYKGVKVEGANITGNVYGGGNLADVTGDTQVNICAKEVTVDENIEWQSVAEGASKVIIAGDVFGAGKGVSESPAGMTLTSAQIVQSAAVKGNSFVYMGGGTVKRSIYGGGELASVGDFNYTDDKPTSLKTAGTGTATVNIFGGTIGPDAMPATLLTGYTGNDLENDLFIGHVFGAGKGITGDKANNANIPKLNYVNETVVTISGTVDANSNKTSTFIKGSVYGGSQNGHVLGNTNVTVNGGQIGCGAGETTPYTEAQFLTWEDVITNKAGVTTETSLKECPSWTYGQETDATKKYQPYDKYTNPKGDDGHTFYGNVFGGGSGFFPYASGKWEWEAGAVYGNTNVTINGGHILTNIYGGNELTNVGKEKDGTTGKCTITFGGTATLGVPRTIDQILAHPLTCYLFGAGKGDQRVLFNKQTNVNDVDITINGGWIYGSVFGGGEDGHVMRDVKMTISGDAKIGTWGTSYVEGNVFGGGRGFGADAYTAGNIAGSVDMDITGGSILGSVYGGGRLGSVGYGLYDKETDGYGEMRADDKFDDGTDGSAFFTHKRGHVDISISGGTIGNDLEFANIDPSTAPATLATWKSTNHVPNTEYELYETVTANNTNSYIYRLKHTKGGNVFAGGMGRRLTLNNTPITEIDWKKLGNVKSTKLTISDNAVIKSNVYGGGELGALTGSHTTNSKDWGTEISITGGTIGTEIGTDDNKYYFGSVYGGGMGDETYGGGDVANNTNVSMTGGKVKASVYGGGEIAVVEGNTDVTIGGGEIGQTKDGDKQFGGATMGNVYGGGKGSLTRWDAGLVKGNTKVTINPGSNGEPKIYHNIYGGGAYGSVGTITTGSATYVPGIASVTDMPTAWTTGGKAEVFVYGGTIGVDGKENGMVFASSRGDVAKPEGATVDAPYGTDVDVNDRLAWVHDTKLVIGGEGKSPTIYGSAYGSGENGHVFQNASVEIYNGTIGVTTDDALGGPNYRLRGNVYGGGCGEDTYEVGTGENKKEYFNPLAGIVLGTANVTIEGGQVVHNVYGAGALGSVVGKTTVTIDKNAIIGVDGGAGGSVFGAARGKEGITVPGSNLANSPETEVNIQGGKIWNSVYGGGEAGYVKQDVKVNVTGGIVAKDVYGGGALADTNTDNWDATKNSGAGGWADGKSSASYKTTVSLTGGTIQGAAYGGALGRKADATNGAIEAMVYGDVLVDLNGTTTMSSGKATVNGVATTNAAGCIVNEIFGGNNVNGSPKGDVMVHVYATQNKDKEDIISKEKGNYDVKAVYGGGNQSAYVPVTAYHPTNATAGSKTQVIIEGCSMTSIETVYGGGNAAAVPETNVEIRSAYEIYNVFGGGNGYSATNNHTDPSAPNYNPGAYVGTLDKGISTYGTGNANTLLIGGLIHEAYGGSNQEGKILGKVNINTAPKDVNEDGYCALDVEKLVGAGKNADVDGDLIMILGCKPTTKTPLVFAGADNADVNGNVELTITSGTFGQVFGGNNLGGYIKGHIVLNIEETGCNPIVIDELYLGGNKAAYSRYGYYNAGTEENPDIQPRTAAMHAITNTSDPEYKAPIGNPSNTDGKHPFPYDQPVLNVISATSIGKVFGGGLGEGAVMHADPTVNINMIPGAFATQELGGPHKLGTIGDVYGGGNEAVVYGKTTVNVGTAETVTMTSVSDDATTATIDESKPYVEGARIIGNIFGGGNQANIEGSTEVNIGTMTYTNENYEGVSINCLKNTADHPDNEEKTGMVFGGGNAADVTGNTVVNIAGGYVENRIYGGGNLGSVGTFTKNTAGKPDSWTSGGKCTVTVSGGKLGKDDMKMPDDFGYVFGASRGEVRDTTVAEYADLRFKTYVKETEVIIKGDAFILGGVYGGSENGHVRGDTWVKIQENCQIGAGFNTTTNLSLARYDNDSFINPATTPVTVDNALATCAAFPYDVATTGKPYDPYHGGDYDSGGATAAGANDGHTFYGNVFGGGSGFFPYAAGKWLRSAGLVEGNTRVDIEGGHILSNVYGGNEQTDVYGTCTINMSGGTIGVPRTKEQIQGHPVIGNLFGAGKGDKRVLFNTWTNVGNTSVNVTGGIVYGSVFGGGEDGHVLGNATTLIEQANEKTITIGSTGESTADGNVFGGGRGSETALTAGVVGGNVSLTIKSGKILGNVYGGGRLASVGTNFTDPNDTKYGQLQDDDATKHGNITININDGTIGVATSETGVNGNIYGGSKGVDGKFDLGIVRSTTINMTNGTAYASVYGGGELAQVVGTHTTDGKSLGTEINISGGIIGKSGKGGATWGNVYGGGKGNTTNVAAGLIKTNTFVKISGTSESPVIHHNIYGGGAYGSVGDFKYDTNNYITGLNTDNTGKAYITILGGKIGNNGKENGMIFGSSRGDVGGIGEIHDKLAWAYDTEVTIGGGETTPQIVGSVYGGGENGHNYHDAVVNVLSGTIGIASGESITSNNGTPDDTSDDITYNGAEYPYRGNVYGGGCGTDKYYSGTVPDGHTADDGEGDKYNPLAGIVYGNATVNITGGTVVRNVYGAGAMGSVGKTNTDGSFTGGQTTINISGGTIGVSGTVGDGNVFGAARGALDASENNLALVNGNTNVSITGGTLYGNVYGGGELGYVGKFTSVTDATTGSKTYTWPEGSGTCNVTIDGATATVKGYVFGAGKGSAETFECEPAMVYQTNVSISKGTVGHNVYGGGQLARVDNNTAVTIGTASGTDEFEIKGDVFGAGAGVATHGYSALVRGDATVTVQGKAKVAGSVYGGGETASVGKFHVVNSLPKEPLSGGTCTVTIQDDAQIGTSGSGAVYGACKGVEPDYANNAGHWKSDNQSYAFDNEAEYLSFLKTLALTSHTVVTINGKASVNGSVYGGGQRGITLGHVNVDMKGGTVSKDVYGGGALADTNTGNAADYGTDTESLTSTSKYTTTVSLTGGTIGGDAYGGGLGRLGKDAVAAQGTPGEEGYVPAQAAISAVEAKVYGDVAVNLGKADRSTATAFEVNKYTEGTHAGIVKSGRVFGCNNLNGSPQGNVTVTVNRTMKGNTEKTASGDLKSEDASKHSYHVAAVYGGGNLAGKTVGGSTNVIINGCDVSIRSVYGGSNAAEVPATDVLVNGAYEIGEVFGGGNGKDDYTLDGGTTWTTNPGANVNGNTNTLLQGGLIHEAYGGSNEKGTIVGSVSINTADNRPADCSDCPLDVEKIVGAGKNADVNGDLIMILGCKPETKTPLVFGGADNANVNGNVELTITSGTFGQVFGGNNLGGVIRGHIILNIEETGCNPIKIDSLYLGGNQAAYSIYGYYNKGTEENPDFQPRTAAMETVAKTDPNYIAPVGNPVEDADHPFPYKQPVLNVVSCTSIDKVFGGGLGKGAIMHADPTVNINMIPGAFANDQTKGVPAVMTARGLSAGDNPNNLGVIGDVFGGGNEADVIGNTTVNIGTASKVQLHESLQADGKTYQMSADKEVKGAYITGSVFGGGKGKADTFTCEKAMIGEDGDGVAHPEGGTNVTIGNGTVCGDVYGGGEIGRVEKNTVVTIGLETGTSAPVIKGNVFGAGKGLETHGYSALVRGNTTVTVQGDAKVRKSVYGGGQIASVARYQVAKTEAEAAEHGVKIDMPYALANSTSGNCKVTIRGNAEIGPEDEMQMTKAGGPDDTGYVFGAGKGVLPKVYDYKSEDDEHMPKRMIEKNGVNTWEYFDTEAKYFEFVQTLGLATNTDVTIGDRAFIKGAVYGGSENGIVQYNTDVKIQDDCQIGAGNGVNRRYNEGEWASESLAECPSWKYEAPYAPYDPYATYKNPADGKYYYNDTYTSYAEGGANIATDGHTYYGNVFGGGSGSVPYFDRFEGEGKSQYISTAGMVKGNTNVTITGGHILTNVYGGCEATNVLGTAKITMTGGTIGVPRTDAQIQAHPLTGYLFGAGKGDQRIFFNKETNVNDAIVTVEGGRIYGSVYGGGEDGHVLRNVAVTIGKADKTGPTIGTRGTSYYDGHVFGGGRGFGGEALTAGNVGGSVEVNIEGGETLGSVYGGGRMASVGYGLYLTTEDGYGVMRDDDKYDGSYPNPSTESASTFYNKGRGHIMMNIKGGTIGNENATGDGAKYSGNVFGGSMGRLELLDGTRSEIWPLMAQVKSTVVNISGDNTTIRRSVYGGGELGVVRDDASVTISGGTIRRDVFGGGYGSEDKQHTVISVNESGTNNTYAYTPMQFAGCVGKSTTVNVSGGYIRKSVYGGGEMASVGIINYRAAETTSEPAADKVKIGPIDGKTYYYENIVKHGDETKEFALSWPYEFKYVDGFEGATHVNITGGRLGLKDSDKDDSLTDNGDVYGAGKGMAGDYKDYLFCANVGSTDVKIAYPSTPTAYSADGDLIAGAVYGGGEDGHVMGDTKLTISGGLINHSVYGAGSGKGKFKATLKKIGKEENYEANIYSITAGKVFGNSTVEMSGGYVVRNIYGGGNMGSVGKGNYAGGADDYSTAGYGEKVDGNLWDDSNKFSTAFLNSGKCTVKITGGTIGYVASDPSSSMYPWNSTASLPYGNVFGGCRGESAPNISETPRYLYSPEFFVGYANETEVTIEGANTKILGSVYGGGMDGHVRRDAHVIINGGEIGLAYNDANKTLLKTEDINNIQWLARGNVYGSGSGIGTYKYDFDYDGKYTSTVTYNGKQTKEEDFSTSAGSVTRFTKVEIKGGSIYRNVYGGGSLSSIGAPKIGQTYNLYSKDDASHSTEVGKQTLNEVIISGGQIGETTGVAVNYGGHMFGGSRGDASLDNSMFSTSMFTKVNIDGGKVLGSVFGGGEVGIVKGSVAVNVTGGEVAKDIYGGGALANTNTENWNPTGGTDGKGGWAAGQVTDGKTTYTTTVNLLGGTVDDVFGGALGQRVGDVTGGTKDIEAFVYGDVNVNLNGLEASDYVSTAHGSFVDPLDKDANNAVTSYRTKNNQGCIVKGEVYGCNNINGTPKGHAKVHVFKTMPKPSQTADDYDVSDVFGGGNNADYVPADTKQATEVIIEGCDLTSIHQVYGGGNAAATPGTSVLVKGTKIIYEVFGGGNGEAEGTKAHVGKKTADDSNYDLGEGKAEVQLMAGNVTYVYGGSNTHGDIRGGSYVTNVTKDNSLGCCEKLNVKEIFAGGKNADMIGGAKIVMGCTNSEDWVEEIYAGAKAANVGGDVSLTLTSGKFGRVFGGNKDSGVLDGSITVNIEENAKCGIPLIIGELYGGGNKAAYSIYGYNGSAARTKAEYDALTPEQKTASPVHASPVLNVRAFTSIGNIFGGGYGSAAEMHGSPTININVVNNNRTTGSIISTAITKTFEEGTENEYTVTIPTHEDRKIGAINNVYGGGNAAKVWGDTNVNIGTEAKQKLVKLDDSGNPLYTDAEKTIPQTEEMDVVGADIRGNVYGGGNAAEVTGNTNVVIGKDGTAATTTTP